MHHMKNDGCRNKCVYYHHVVWKFAPAILNPVWAFKSPLQALLAIGSMQHIVVGCVIASVYIVWKSKRNNFRFVFY